MWEFCNDLLIKIPLTKGFVAQVDPQDRDMLDFKWTAQVSKSGNVYAVRYLPFVDGKRPIVLMHRAILGRILERELLKTELVDHWNGDGCDNRRENLRLANYDQNARNRRGKAKSGFKGVYFNGDVGRWYAQILVDGKRESLGTHETPEQAHEAYKAAAIQHYGEFARFEDGE